VKNKREDLGATFRRCILVAMRSDSVLLNVRKTFERKPKCGKRQRIGDAG
jgi:hypothetical protein